MDTNQRYEQAMEDETKVVEEKKDASSNTASFLYGILGLLAIAAVVWLAIKAFQPKTIEPDITQSSWVNERAGLEIQVDPISSNASTTLESPDARSAASNSNFIGYFGSRGKDWTVPSKVLDTNGKEREVGSVLYTWCETERDCYYMVLKPSNTITQGHQASQINIYAPSYVGLEANELQYIQTIEGTKWTAVK
jgi:hypothetical protein